MLTVELAEDAGRATYLAGYHAAEAFIFERTGRVTKTHKGAHSEFARLARYESAIDTELRRFLPRAYDLRAICDFGVGPESVVPMERAVSAVEEGRTVFGLHRRLAERIALNQTRLLSNDTTRRFEA
jgi:uncharacterized protein (UPF0332 family)